MNVEVITRDDLQAFRLQLLEDLKSLMASTQPSAEKTWLRSRDVREMLKISSGTLQNLRISEKLHPTKIGGIFYYRAEEIAALFGNSALLDQPVSLTVEQQGH